MRSLLLFLLALPTMAFHPIGSSVQTENVSPLSVFSSEWNKPQYLVCNTAANTDYLSENEKTVIYILNLARMNPPLFAQTVVKAYPDYSGNSRLLQSDYYIGLLAFLKNKIPLPRLYPERSLFESARCHAETSGKTGYIGHNRRTKDCKIVMDLLIDEGVPSLGHRIILFRPHTQIGVSIQPHKKYRWNAVLDLG
jgi:hypothetical protein